MARSSANLTVVKGSPVHDPRPAIDPDAELTSLFASEAVLLRALAEVRAALPAARRRYAERHGLTIMLPGIDRLRALLGPKPKGAGQ